MHKIFITAVLFLFFFSACKNNSYEVKKEETYRMLESILKLKKKQLIQQMTETRELARQLKNDKAMNAFFRVKNEYYYKSRDTVVSDFVEQKIKELKQDIQYHYVQNYLTFYDILFTDKNGEIFYTIRKQADYHKNIFEGELANTALSKKLRNLSEESFVDFQFYEVSGEPSAFFIEPVTHEGKTIGWFVMQYAINKINNLFTTETNLGRTGELILVNKEHYMLTDSRFKAKPTILKQKLPDENIDAKFEEKKGRKSVTDYRGKVVYSAFDVFQFLSNEWLLIAKIDQNEIITQHYLENKPELYPQISSQIRSAVPQPTDIPGQPERKVIGVDIDEYQRADSFSALTTQGVSECTALIAGIPGMFSYMAHISPYDVIYDENRTNLIQRILHRIDYIEITEAEKQSMQFFLVSAQPGSLQRAIDIILENGYFLSQIKVLIRQDRDYANIYADLSNNQIIITWIDRKNNTVTRENFKHFIELNDMILHH